MSEIAEKRKILLRGLVRSLPQASLRSLEMALGLTSEPKMVAVRDLISSEMEFRHTCRAVFAPFMPLFEPRTDGLVGVSFPNWIINTLWSALESREPELQEEARHALRSLRTEDPTPVVFFRLVTAGAHICRTAPDLLLRKDATDEERDEVVEFGHYLDLHRLARQVLGRLGDFMGRIDADKAAALRVMFKDASDLDTESGTRFMEIIFANLEDGAQIVKFVATVSDRPSDRFLAESEMADFGDRILDRIESDLAELKAFMGGKNTTGGKASEDPGAAGGRIASCLGQLQAFGQYIELSRGGPWGKRVTEAQQVVAGLVEQQIKGAEKALDKALPTRTERVYGRMKKDVPDFAHVPNETQMAQAHGALAFMREVRHIANAGGFASLHAKTTEACEASLDAYFTELLSIANGEDPFDREQLLGGFERVTDLMEALCGEEKAQVARRRVASSDLMNPSKNVA
ncbi:MAG: hypothetical protein QM647_01860 [Asticcacaulis sp.]|uniref:hypothetical protein n=1 Tax=Asticcacaulis sp. TaxID=1872648 RepID=UPI0039E64B0C